jgi:aryl-alcohol dehydrogenase-like predicted oxidoreductase
MRPDPPSRIGLGCWAMGGPAWEWGWGPQDDAASIATIHAAAAAGMAWLDTAASYGLGHGEEVVGRALRELPAGDRPLVATKGGTAWEPGDRGARRVSEPAALRRHLEASLRRLGADSVDLYQLHWPGEDGTPVEESWAAMRGFVAAGLAREVGVCNYSVELLDRCRSVGAVDSVQAPLSLIDRSSAATVVPWCVEHGARFLAYSPLQSGLLGGRFDAGRLASDDWRLRDPEFRAPRLACNLALVEALGAVAGRHEATIAQVAVAWVLAWPAASAIVGARRPDQLDGWDGASRLDLTEADLDAIALAVERSGAGAGPARPGAIGVADDHGVETPDPT